MSSQDGRYNQRDSEEFIANQPRSDDPYNYAPLHQSQPLSGAVQAQPLIVSQGQVIQPFQQQVLPHGQTVLVVTQNNIPVINPDYEINNHFGCFKCLLITILVLNVLGILGSASFSLLNLASNVLQIATCSYGLLALDKKTLQYAKRFITLNFVCWGIEILALLLVMAMSPPTTSQQTSKTNGQSQEDMEADLRGAELIFFAIIFALRWYFWSSGKKMKDLIMLKMNATNSMAV